MQGLKHNREGFSCFLPDPSTSSFSPLYLCGHKLGLLLFFPNKADSPYHPTLRLVPTK